MPAHNDGCFVCGADRPNGLQMHMIAGEGVTVTARFRITDYHQGAHGLAHGGVLSAACDEVLGGLLWMLRVPAVTARLEVDFRVPVPVGHEVFLSSECTGVRGRKIHGRCEGRLDAPDAPVAVTASALFLRVPLEHFSRHGQPRDAGHGADDTLYAP